MKYSAIINGLQVDAVYSEESIYDIFIPLLRRLTELQRRENRRIIVMLAAPPAAGKSTLLSFLEYLAKDTEGVEEISVTGIDGFHRRQEYLTSHDVIVDGKPINMVKIKGAPITFDFEKLRDKVKELKMGKLCRWPLYDRKLHNPVEDAIVVDKDIVILEGNYLLLKEKGWEELKDFADYTILITADIKDLRQRLIDRKSASGMQLEEAEKFVEFSDLRNAKLCIENSFKADMMLKLNPDNSYKIL